MAIFTDTEEWEGVQKAATRLLERIEAKKQEEIRLCKESRSYALLQIDFLQKTYSSLVEKLGKDNISLSYQVSGTEVQIQGNLAKSVPENVVRVELCFKDGTPKGKALSFFIHADGGIHPDDSSQSICYVSDKIIEWLDSILSSSK